MAIKVTVGGKSFPSLAAAAEAFGVSISLVRNRIRQGWTLEEALGLTPRPRAPSTKGRKITVNGIEFQSLRAATEHYGLPRWSVHNRLSAGWTVEQVFGLSDPPRKRRDLSSFEEIDGRLLPKGQAGSFRLYLITNTVNKKEYVGVTIGSLKKRWGEHLSMGAGSADTLLKRAIRKHGVSNFKIEELRSDAKDYRELMQQEIQEIAARGTYGNGYNATAGGEITFNARSVVVGEMEFPTLRAAADYFNIDDGLLRARIDAMGWSIEEAVGLVDRPKTKYAPRGKTTVGGHTFDSQKDAAKHFGIGFQRYSLRTTRYGWTPEQALGLAPPPNGPSGVSVEVVLKDGQRFKSLSAASTHFGVSGGVAHHRLSIGWTLEQALGLEPKPKRRDRAGHKFQIGGLEFPTQKAAAEHFGVNYKQYHERVKRKGWTPEQALGIAPPPPEKIEKIMIGSQVFCNLAAAAKHFGLARGVVYDRIRLGWSVEKALTTPRRRSKK
jgi:hypothetical protein